MKAAIRSVSVVEPDLVVALTIVRLDKASSQCESQMCRAGLLQDRGQVLVNLLLIEQVRVAAERTFGRQQNLRVRFDRLVQRSMNGRGVRGNVGGYRNLCDGDA